MASPTPEQEQLINEQTIGMLATLMRDGTPQLTPINYAYQDGRFLMSTTKERAKYHNIRRNATVSLAVAGDGWRPYVTVYGTAEIEEQDYTRIAEGTAAVASRMSDRPLPDNFADALRQQKRVLIVLTPERFVP
jgi:PPOX class probable F420-dependent enzyme